MPACEVLGEPQGVLLGPSDVSDMVPISALMHRETTFNFFLLKLVFLISNLVSQSTYLL